MEKAQIDNIVENNNIVDVISSYFPLKKAGMNYKARCPFHEEKTASFIVSEKKQIYKCFGCGKAGNVVSFVMDYEKVSFIEAMKKLAARVGITIAEPKVDKVKRSKRDLIYKVYQLTNQHYRENLRNYGTQAKDYLLKRGFSETTIKDFEIGYALDGYNALKNFLEKNQVNSKILPLTGLFSRGERGLFDTFRNRLMFPIHSATGKVVAFGGRKLQKDQGGGKYINSPTTEIYTKGNELYGLYRTRYEIQKKDFALICEGYTDFLRLYEKGFTNTVASLGTSLTDAQISLLSRFTRNFYLVYDGDAAGRKAAVRAAGNALSSGLNVKVIALDENEDPDGFLATRSTEKFQKLITEAETAVQFIYHDQVMGLDQKGKVDLLVEMLNEIEDALTREFQVKEIAEQFGISTKSILSRIRLNFRKTNTKKELVTFFKYEEERDLLKLLLNEKTSLKKVAQEIDSSYFLFRIYRDVYDFVCNYLEQNENITGIMNSVEDEILKNTIAELLMEECPEQDPSETLKTVILRKLEKDLTEINQMLYKNNDDEDLQAQKNKIKEKILTLNSKIVRKTLY